MIGEAQRTRGVVLSAVYALDAAAHGFRDGGGSVEPQREHRGSKHRNLVPRELRRCKVRNKEQHNEGYPAEDRRVEVQHQAQGLARQHLEHGDEKPQRKS